MFVCEHCIISRIKHKLHDVSIFMGMDERVGITVLEKGGVRGEGSRRGRGERAGVRGEGSL